MTHVAVRTGVDTSWHALQPAQLLAPASALEYPGLDTSPDQHGRRKHYETSHFIFYVNLQLGNRESLSLGTRHACYILSFRPADPVCFARRVENPSSKRGKPALVEEKLRLVRVRCRLCACSCNFSCTDDEQTLCTRTSSSHHSNCCPH